LPSSPGAVQVKVRELVVAPLTDRSVTFAGGVVSTVKLTSAELLALTA